MFDLLSSFSTPQAWKLDGESGVGSIVLMSANSNHPRSGLAVFLFSVAPRHVNINTISLLAKARPEAVRERQKTTAGDSYV